MPAAAAQPPCQTLLVTTIGTGHPPELIHLSNMLAYLVIREGPKWTDVFRLVEGRTVTIGRSPTNQIVVKDERCSRYHAEVFSSQGHWTLRDLDSRNGTEVAGQRIRGDYVLKAGDVFRVAHAQMAFVHDLSSAFPEAMGGESGPVVVDETVEGRVADETDVLAEHEPTTITHRRGDTRFLSVPNDAEEAVVPSVGQSAAKLCRVAFELAKQTDVSALAQLAVDGLFESTKVDSGAVLLLPRGYRGAASGKELNVIASRSDKESSYHRLSTFLATTVLRDGEAVLARNIADDSTLGSRDSQGEIHATSVICAPIRSNSKVVGLIHLYSTDETRCPDPEDLEFALAVADNMGLALENIARQQELAESLNYTTDEIVQLRQRLGVESELVGSSQVMLNVQEQVLQASPSRATILIRGESGVGKELVARAVHFHSPRKQGPFVCINCAALSETLLESELFGHEKGAFTGATDRKIGKFEAADKGTLMLDEIGEMSESIQAKFLRVLEGHPFERVGGSEAIKADVRVIAATNRDLERAVSEGAFRRDLYFRLNVVEIKVPPLRKRSHDVEELAHYFLTRFRAETGGKVKDFTLPAMERLRSYRWPGNVRELKNVIERAVVLARGTSVDVDDLHLSNLATASDSGELHAALNHYEPMSLAECEKRQVQWTLDANSWNKSKTAMILGIERSTLDRKIRRYELKPNPKLFEN